MTQRGLWGSVLFGLGFIFCPCHLLVTLPLLGAWLGGTAFTGMLFADIGLVTVVSTVLFIGFLALGWRLVSQKQACVPVGEVTHEA
jgi:mercuric ion transport protein